MSSACRDFTGPVAKLGSSRGAMAISCGSQSGCMSSLLCIAKLMGKKGIRRSGGGQPATSRRAGLGRLRCLGDGALELGDVLQKSLAAQFGDAAGGSRAAVFLRLVNLHKTCLAEHVEVPVEVAIRQIAQCLQVGKR